jgi:predicted transcriptional regulator
MNANDVLNRPVVAASRTTTARDVAFQTLMGGFSGMPITERDGEVVGAVSEADIIHALRGGKALYFTTAGEIMTGEVMSVNLSATVDQVIKILDTMKVVWVPVIRDGKLVGVISWPDSLRAFVQPTVMTFS